MKTTILKVENQDILGSLRKFLAQLLESGFVETILVPKMLPGGDGFVQALIKDPGMLKDTNPAAPTMAVQSARILSELTSIPLNVRIGAVLKPCELRAATELTKFLQVNLDNVVTIGIDCVETYDVREYAEMVKNGGESLPQTIFEFVGENHGSREACRICEHPVPLNADMAFGFLGYDPSEEILLTVGERFEKELREKLSLEMDEGKLGKREKAVEKILAERNKERARVLTELKERVNGLEKLMQTLSTCIRCHNCINACPICYCKECVFDSAVFEHRPDQFLKWAARQGAIRLPGDTLIFHLTRMSHMATSCVSCGMCESACPSRLPISRLFSLIGGDLQKLFEYVPGRDAAEEPPVSIFKEDELQAESRAE